LIADLIRPDVLFSFRQSLDEPGNDEDQDLMREPSLIDPALQSF
jgi:hypothetical protein